MGDPVIDSPADALAFARAKFAEYGGESVNVGDLLCDRHAGNPSRLALRHEDAAGSAGTLTYAELKSQSERFATVLGELGVGPGDRVATLLPKTPELMIAVLGIWRLGAVHVPLFTAFGPQAVEFRVQHSGALVVITDSTNRAKLDGLTSGGKAPRIITVTNEDPGSDVSFKRAVADASNLTKSVHRSGADPMILLYTSGTTGHPKGVVVPIKALASFEVYARFGLDVRDDDVFWNIADPGWAYGLYYALISPLLIGTTTLLVNAPFSAEGTERIWRKYGVTNFAAAPTVYRALRAAGTPAAGREGLRLRAASSAGEPLNPEVIAWAADSLGIVLNDHYGQTEHAMFVINHNHPAASREVRAGSMGHSMIGFRAVVLDPDGHELGPGQPGTIAIDIPNSPLYWFPGYFQNTEATARCYSGDGRYYISGDAATSDADEYITFAGRADDLINSGGYRIGPFEVESALVGHPAVAEVAVIGVPDELRGEIVKSYIVLRTGFTGSDELAGELQTFVKRRLAAHAYPRIVEFVEVLPKTPSGKIQRYVLRKESIANA